MPLPVASSDEHCANMRTPGSLSESEQVQATQSKVVKQGDLVQEI